MESSELLPQGLNLMLLGMGTVFVFLTILVFVTALMSFLVQKYTPATVIDSKYPGVSQALEAKNSASNSTDKNTHLLAIISAAIHAHRSKK